MNKSITPPNEANTIIDFSNQSWFESNIKKFFQNDFIENEAIKIINLTNCQLTDFEFKSIVDSILLRGKPLQYLIFDENHLTMHSFHDFTKLVSCQLVDSIYAWNRIPYFDESQLSELKSLALQKGIYFSDNKFNSHTNEAPISSSNYFEINFEIPKKTS